MLTIHNEAAKAADGTIRAHDLPCQWIEDLQCLVVRFSHLGIGSDLASMSKNELWGLYLHLSRLAGG